MIRRFAVAICAAVFLAGSSVPSVAQVRPVIHIATIPIDSGSQAFYADAMGFFAKNGLDVKIDRISNGPAIAAGVASGALDIGFSNLVSLETAYKRGVPITLIAAAGLYLDSAPTTLLVVDKTSPMKTAKDLNGKIIATNGLKNIGQFAPEAWIDKNGGDSTTVKFVEMPFTEMAGALATHRIDAAIMAEPALTEARPTTRVIGKAYSAVGNEYLIGSWFATSTWAKAHPDLVQRFDAAMRDAAIWANKNQAKSAEILAKYAEMDARTVATMTRSRFAEALTPALVQPTIDLSAKYHAFDAPFPAQEFIFQPAR